MNAAAHGYFTGSAELLPLIGGSGGGGGSSTASCYSGGGGGGGGAILLAVNGTLRIGQGGGGIHAYGGSAGTYSGGDCSPSAAGSGGAIRIVAYQVSGADASFLYAYGGGGTSTDGRIRLEAVVDEFAGALSPPGVRTRTPGVVSLPVTPRARIVSVGGEAAPTSPQGWRGQVDILVPEPGPVTVEIETTAVPGGTTVDLTAKPDVGSRAIEQGSGLLQSCDASLRCRADVTLDLEAGAYFLEARATYAVP